MEIYGAAVADELDAGRNILRRRYYRQHCTPDFGSYTKDLSAINNDLNNVSELHISFLLCNRQPITASFIPLRRSSSLTTHRVHIGAFPTMPYRSSRGSPIRWTLRCCRCCRCSMRCALRTTCARCCPGICICTGYGSARRANLFGDADVPAISVCGWCGCCRDRARARACVY